MLSSASLFCVRRGLLQAVVLSCVQRNCVWGVDAVQWTRLLSDDVERGWGSSGSDERRICEDAGNDEMGRVVTKDDKTEKSRRNHHSLIVRNDL